MIEAYVSELADSLSGPRRLKDDMVTEARHSLLDAAEAYQELGLAPVAAERRAVAEFGQVAEVAPAYQAELGVAQGRRTALLMICVLAPQNLVWTGARAAGSLGSWYALLQASMPWLGGVAIVACVAAALASGLGTRFLGPHRPVTRATGVFALSTAAFFAAASMVLATVGNTSPAPLGLHGLPLAVLAVVAPMAAVAWSARRTLVASSRPAFA